jgi:leucyl/phenylalanyl-tRNA--protein transferase
VIDIPVLSPFSVDFPPPERALAEPNGLLALGGDLTSERLLNAYRLGIFPWFSEDQPILWWSPEPRAVLFPHDFHCGRSLRKTLRNQGFEVRFDEQFERVMRACAAPRKDGPGTWISEDMVQAYCLLHEQGWAHSVETYLCGKLVGGLYGLSIGSLFFGESMFSERTDASKVALATLLHQLRRSGFPLIDCQLPNPHLTSLGATSVSRATFLSYLRTYLNRLPDPDPWSQPWPQPHMLTSTIATPPSGTAAARLFQQKNTE